MKPHRHIAPEDLDRLLTEVVLNQRAEGFELTADEVALARLDLLRGHVRRRSWSPSWDVLAALAVALGRPDLLAGGRAMEVFAIAVLTTAAASPEDAWGRVAEAIEAGRRGLVVGVLEALEAGPQALEKADQVRLANLERGIAAARRAGWPERLETALRGHR